MPKCTIYCALIHSLIQHIPLQVHPRTSNACSDVPESCSLQEYPLLGGLPPGRIKSRIKSLLYTVRSSEYLRLSSCLPFRPRFEQRCHLLAGKIARLSNRRGIGPVCRDCHAVNDEHDNLRSQILVRLLYLHCLAQSKDVSNSEYSIPYISQHNRAYASIYVYINLAGRDKQSAVVKDSAHVTI